MVLALKRAAHVAMVLAIHATIASAQQGVGPNLSPTGTARPLLYGFALECVDCQSGARGRVGRGNGGPPAVWSYTSFPRVFAVAPGTAAEQAGVRPGDLLLTIDGLSVLTDAGAQRFARASSGEEVRLTFERDSKPIAVSLVLGGSGGRGTRSGPITIANGYMAISGPVHGDLSIEIWSDEPIFPRDSTDTVVLRIGTSTIIKMRLKKDSTDANAGPTGRGNTSRKPEPEL